MHSTDALHSGHHGARRGDATSWHMHTYTHTCAQHTCPAHTHTQFTHGRAAAAAVTASPTVCVCERVCVTKLCGTLCDALVIHGRVHSDSDARSLVCVCVYIQFLVWVSVCVFLNLEVMYNATERVDHAIYSRHTRSK